MVTARRIESRAADRVDANAGLLHAQEHGDEWEVDVLVDVGERALLDQREKGQGARDKRVPVEHLLADGPPRLGSSRRTGTRAGDSASCSLSVMARRATAAAASGRRSGSYGFSLLG